MKHYLYLLFLLPVALLAQPGALDLSFNPGAGISGPDSWTEVKLTDWPAEVRLTRFDRSDVFFKEETGGEGRPQRVLAVRGKGRHRIEIEFRSPLRRNNRICQAVVPYLARPFSITATPHGTTRVSERWPQHDGVAIVPGTSATASSNSSAWVGARWAATMRRTPRATWT